jgi:hypothetical protein
VPIRIHSQINVEVTIDIERERSKYRIARRKETKYNIHTNVWWRTEWSEYAQIIDAALHKRNNTKNRTTQIKELLRFTFQRSASGRFHRINAANRKRMIETSSSIFHGCKDAIDGRGTGNNVARSDTAIKGGATRSTKLRGFPLDISLRSRLTKDGDHKPGSPG